MGRYKLVVFDVGGVLVRTGRTWPEDAALAGYTFEDEWLQGFYERRRGLPGRELGEVPVDEYCALLASVSDGRLTAEDIRRITAASPIAEYPGASRVFDALEGKEVETALLCNLHELEWDRFFPAEGVTSEFPTLARARHRFGSHRMHLAKPDRRAYEYVERGAGFSGGEILFFDDRLENVQAARDVGWSAEVIDHEGDTVGQVIDLLRQHEVI